MRFEVSRLSPKSYFNQGITGMKNFPNARRHDLIVEELADEVLVYDLKTDQAHCLNRMSALIWKNCDGEKNETEIAAALAQELQSPVSVPVVMLGLEELASFDLLQNETNEASGPGKLPPATVSRRQLIQNLGLAATLSLPLIMSISTPTAAGVGGSTTDPCIANPRGIGCPCNTDFDCDSANCNGGTCGPELRPQG
jgi:hypothetical protein